MSVVTEEVLAAIPSTEPATFAEFCRALPDCPERGDREGWAELFMELTTLEGLGLVEIDRASYYGGSDRINSLQLTEAGAAAVRARRRR